MNLIKHDTRVIIYDFETDGFWVNSGANRPISFSAIWFDENFTKIGTESFLIKRRDNTPLPDKITEITGLTTEVLNRDGITIEEAFKKIEKIFDVPARLVVGHNILNFDNKFLNFRFSKYDMPCIVEHRECFDTGGEFKAELMGWDKFPNISCNEYHIKALNVRRKDLFWNLNAAIEHYEIEKRWNRETHDSFVDVLYNTLVFLNQIYHNYNMITAEQIEKSIRIVNELANEKGVPKMADAIQSEDLIDDGQPSDVKEQSYFAEDDKLDDRPIDELIDKLIDDISNSM